MAELKCKMCGGRLVFPENATICECEFCGTYQTLPKSNDENKLARYDRANQLRQSNEYDKAIAIYEDLLKEDPNDADIYWSMVLCRYGVEYVKDPASGKQIPTINRMQYTSIFDDADYKAALQHCDISQKMLYESEAKAINQIQKQSLAIVENEEPFDVFICYKETDDLGARTRDSVYANELYYELVDSGFKVFYAPITLEDKLGSEYEPYIFAALNSAKVMVALATKPEYFRAPWVKNEWSRYLALIKGGAKKKLIPAYRDMSPYDMPEEFAHLQAQDMSKIGFVQQLIRGINLLIPKESPAPAAAPAPTAAPAAAPAASKVDDLLRRAKVFLEDENWDNTTQCAKDAIYADPACGPAHLYLLLAANRVSSIAKLVDYSGDSLEDNKYFNNAMKYCDEPTKKALQDVSERVICKKFENKYIDVYPFSDLSKFASTYAKLGGVGEYTGTDGKPVRAYAQFRDIQAKLNDVLPLGKKYNAFGTTLEKEILAPIHRTATGGDGWCNTDPRCLLNAVALLRLIAPYYPKSQQMLDKYADDIELHDDLSAMNAFSIRTAMEKVQEEHADDQDYLDGILPIYEDWLKLKARLEKNEADARAAREREEQAHRQEQERKKELERQRAIEYAEEQRKKKKRNILIAILAVVVIVGAIVGNFVVLPMLSGGFMGGTKTADGVTYRDMGDYIVLEKKVSKDDVAANLNIPGEMNGKPVREISAKAVNYTDIKTLTIGEGVEIIGDQAFQSCSKLESVSLPSTITSIGSDAFFSCDSVETFTFNGTMAQWEAIEIESGAFAWSSIKEVVCTDGTVSLR